MAKAKKDTKTIEGPMGHYALFSEESNDAYISLGVSFTESKANEKRALKICKQTKEAINFIDLLCEKTEQAHKNCPEHIRANFEKLLKYTIETFGEGHDKIGSSVALCAAEKICALDEEIAQLKQRNETLEFMVSSQR